MLFKTIKPDRELKLTNGVGLKNVGAHNARLGLTLPSGVKILRNSNQKKNNNSGK